MNPYKAELLAKQLMKEYMLIDCGWTFKFDNAKRRFGRCQYGPKRITLSKPLTIANDETQVRDTILHEIAHALRPGQGHNEKWKECCRMIGANPHRCYDDSEVNTLNAPYGLYCPTCDEVVGERYRKTGTVFLHKTCKTEVEWIIYG